MFARDYLNLRLVKLKAAEGWSGANPGLSFVFLKGGLGKFLAGPRAHRVSPGDVLVAGADPRAKLCVANGEELVFWAFALCVEHLFPLFAGDEISLLNTVVEGFNGLRLYPAASPLAKQCHRLVAEAPPQFSLDHRGHLLRVAAAILSDEFKTALHARGGFVRVEDHLIRVFEKLSSEELLNSSVGELATKFSCSRRHLNRLFHQYFGFSVAALRMEMRLLKAVSLLRDPDTKVITVAEQCGFNHLGLFNTCFKKRFGASPGQWRKSAMTAQAPIGHQPNKDSHCPLRTKGLCPWTAPAELAVAPVASLLQPAAGLLLPKPQNLDAGNEEFGCEPPAILPATANPNPAEIGVPSL